ncbi:hypothetical protein CEUSTIGMA_g295.t1 [Chlamydomonas eustigma]|uniref:Uncharacterized protein n=1 Tax=Chlamydomonas eustigma TaxID=1157962 RepID=A0A250WQL5_9CHLO|nr:hypothetical protein CEUSTIGMA_g295.t1 [Chlamydomonas eustigma]|eukprot:GAX72840.1 hypothetical protein CEUSTIGMA_g295.t1 [Chlamydomonas eustigma]
MQYSAVLSSMLKSQMTLIHHFYVNIRVQQLKEMAITFAANEALLHSGTSQLGSAHACLSLETVVVLRNGAQRSQSHIAEVIRVYKRISRGAFRYHTPVTLEDWKTFAPAVVDNYMTRFLLGRHYMHCRDFGTLGEPELLAASLALSSIDHVMVLGQDDLNDVVMKAGMGWSSGLRSKRWRWASQGDLEKDYGFRNGSKALLEEWNHLDQKLLTWGSLILKLDALFHGGVAAVSGHLRRSAWQQASAGERLLEQSMNSDSPRGVLSLYLLKAVQ